MANTLISVVITWIKHNTTLRSLIHGPLQHNEELFTVANYIPNASWNLNTISFQLPHDITQQIHTIYLPHTSL